MSVKKFCPIIKGNCMKADCVLWVRDYTKVTNLKTHKTGIKDTSNCAFEKMGEQAVIKIWEDAERLINQQDKHCGNCGKKDWCKSFSGYGELDEFGFWQYPLYFD